MTDTEWTKEYIKHRDRAAMEHYRENEIADHVVTVARPAPRWSGFCHGADWGATYERERAKVLVEYLKALKQRARGNYEYYYRKDVEEVLAKYGETGE